MSSDAHTVIPQKGDVLTFPNPSADAHPITVQWQQMMRQRSEEYYEVTAYDENQKGNVLVYVQKNWFEVKNTGDSNHVTHFNKKDDGSGFSVTIDDRFQYGQKDKTGACRFVVYHDKSRGMFQHRFLTTTALGKGSTFAKKFVNNFLPKDQQGDAKFVMDKIAAMVGDKLHTF